MIDTNLRPSFSECDEEDATAELLRMATARPGVAADRAARVRRAVYGQWHTEARRGMVRRRTIAAATVVLATAATVTLTVMMRPAGVLAPAGASVAIVERTDGDVRVMSDSGAASRGTIRLSSNDSVRTGQWVETSATSRAALRLAGGTSVRLDTGSRARLLSSTVIDLAEGAVYLDTGSSAPGLEVRTPFGTAHDVGTQFEVRLRVSSVRIRVRTGKVELRRGDQSMTSHAGTELTMEAGGAVSGTVRADGPEWEWAAGLAPAFEIEGRPLGAFLDHCSREQGWTLRYANAALATGASSIILHGSVGGLAPQDALSVALTTSGLDHRFQDGELFVFRSANANQDRTP